MGSATVTGGGRVPFVVGAAVGGPGGCRVIGRAAKTRAYALFGRLPRWLRVFVTRRVSPNFNVGAMCIVRRHDGAVLLLRNSYRPGWGLPGGMFRRGEGAIDAARREVHEE